MVKKHIMEQKCTGFISVHQANFKRYLAQRPKRNRSRRPSNSCHISRPLKLKNKVWCEHVKQSPNATTKHLTYTSLAVNQTYLQICWRFSFAFLSLPPLPTCASFQVFIFSAAALKMVFFLLVLLNNASLPKKHQHAIPKMKKAG